MNEQHNSPSSGAGRLIVARPGRSLEEAISECERELNVRDRCFTRWVNEGKIDRVDAQDRLDRLFAAVRILRQVQIAGEEAITPGAPGAQVGTKT